jgi:Flp pilus assembly protein TadD
MEPAETQSLRLQIERSLRGAFDPADVLPRLARLARLAAPASDDGVFANHKLAELLVERDPWRAALYVRRALEHRPNDDRPWAILAFCQTLLGNFRCATSAYRKAIACAPSNPWYAHNLGHLLDVALGEPVRALDWLSAAYAAKADNSEIVASYVHALARAGKTYDARRVLERAQNRFDSRELDALMHWLDQGAPSRPRRGARRGGVPRSSANGWPASKESPPPSSEGAAPAGGLTRAPRKLARVLERGLSHLPLDSRQRERALALARDAFPTRSRRSKTKASESKETPSEQVLPKPKPPLSTPQPALSTPQAQAPDLSPPPPASRPAEVREDVAGLAAAVAYAIVYIDHVPLSQAEVAASFRVGVGHLRGRFAELRAKLDIIRGDTRYATTRH